LNKIGFEWNASFSDLNSRAREITDLQGLTYDYDLDGDGFPEPVPLYSRPDGSRVIGNTVTEGILDAIVNPGPTQSTFNIAGTILDNEDGDTLSVTFDYLNSLSESELLSAPRVTTMNRKPAVIADFLTQVRQTGVYSEVWTTEGGFGGTPSVASQSYPITEQFIFGITFSVTPQIIADNQVRMWLNPQITEPQGETTFTSTTQVGDNVQENTWTIPTWTTRAVWTNVIVHDGDTLVLGGLVEDRTERGNEKMPYLADIPILGFFFRGKSHSTEQRSLLIFVTPEIVDSTGARAGSESESSF